ncbi:hypothetical protein [Streptomyces sp. NPDC057250]|uniref:hypothetical protein n=1 Tax=Streptomyces sp. NPDC057250 TaxID=3346068 RepID=UPI003626DA81
MSLDTLPVYRGLRVPRVARWSAEQDITPRVYLQGGRLVYRDPDLTRVSTQQGALWRVWSLAPGKGVPLLANLHPARQRRMMVRSLCQVCGLSTATEAAAEGGQLVLTGSGEVAGRGPIEEQERTMNPPLHLACAWESVRRCPHLLEGYAAARVTDARPWGLHGILHAPEGRRTAAGDLAVALVSPAQIAYEDSRLPLVLAGQTILELTGVRPVDLRVEAARAGLDGAEAGR